MKIKEANLLSIIQSHITLNYETKEEYFNYLGVKIKEEELNDLQIFVDELYKIIEPEQNHIFNNFFIGFTIPQIGKEFDLLKIDNDKILNLEIKVRSDKETITNQLVKNKYYLNFLNKQTRLFTFISESKKIYELDEQDKIQEIDFPEFLNFLLKINNCNNNLNDLFKPSNYLVSPFNSTDAFVKGQYFLTQNQNEYKAQILKKLEETQAHVLAIKGKAGCGKTLLTYDIANEFKKSKNVYIIHCGQLNDGHCKLKDSHKWSITSIKYALSEIDFSNNDLIIIDEAQRISLYQLKLIIEQILINKSKCIFSYDEAQTLSKGENSCPDIEKKLTSPPFVLTKKIRTNKELSNFIKCLFDFNEPIRREYRFPNIEIQYFYDIGLAMDYINYSRNNGWKFINYTPERNSTHYDSTKIHDEYDNSHKVIGQEFDNVILVMDSSFCYRYDKLTTRKTTYYPVPKMLFQNITRVKSKLRLVIVNNQDVFKRSINIIS